MSIEAYNMSIEGSKSNVNDWSSIKWVGFGCVTPVLDPHVRTELKENKNTES